VPFSSRCAVDEFWVSLFRLSTFRGVGLVWVIGWIKSVTGGGTITGMGWRPMGLVSSVTERSCTFFCVCLFNLRWWILDVCFTANFCVLLSSGFGAAFYFSVSSFCWCEITLLICRTNSSFSFKSFCFFSASVSSKFFSLSLCCFGASSFALNYACHALSLYMCLWRVSIKFFKRRHMSWN